MISLSAFPQVLSKSQADAIPWLTDFEQAETLARQQGRPLWVQFHGPWCPKCRQMEATTFVSEPVIRLARDHFVSVAIQSDHRLDLVGRFGVSGLPATLILAPDGQILVQQEGYIDPLTFAAWLQDVASRFPDDPEPSVESPALDGYCPVTLVQQGRLKAGSADVAIRYDGRLYQFADTDTQAEFLEDPERYLPSNGGYCLVHQVDDAEARPGNPSFGVYYKQRLYLCADEAARQRFAEDPEHFVKAYLR